MLGALAGDIIGSVYEWKNLKTTHFDLFSPDCFFTDDSVLTVALADAILTNRSYETLMKEYYNLYPDAGYGGFFRQWAKSQKSKPYNSWGNGAAMRISPVGYAFDTIDEVLSKAKDYTEITHSHPEGIKGAQATASAIYLSRSGKSKKEIKEYIASTFGYDLSKCCDEIRPYYSFNESCQGTVPEAITAFLDSTDFESALRLAISLGGDSDTLACITGGIAQAFYGGVPKSIAERVLFILEDKLRDVAITFCDQFCKI